VPGNSHLRIIVMEYRDAQRKENLYDKFLSQLCTLLTQYVANGKTCPSVKQYTFSVKCSHKIMGGQTLCRAKFSSQKSARNHANECPISKDSMYLNLGCLHPVACLRSRWMRGFFRLRNVNIVSFIIYLIATCFSHSTIFRQKYFC
jgi:hypothetical protein